MEPRGETQGRTVIVPASFFAALGLRLTRDFGPNAAEAVLYDVGRDAGISIAKTAMRHRRDEPGEDYFRELLERFDREYRWADITLEELDTQRRFAVVTWTRGVAVPTGGSPRPVCHLGRGLLSGAAEVALGEAYDAIELQCQATGADRCRIVVGERSRVAELAEELD